MKKDAAAFSLYLFPVDQVFRRTQTDHKSIYDLGTAKRETLEELNRLAADVGGGLHSCPVS